MGPSTGNRAARRQPSTPLSRKKSGALIISGPADDGMPANQVTTFQVMVPPRGAEDHRDRDNAGMDDAFAHRRGRMQTEVQERHEVEEGCA